MRHPTPAALAVATVTALSGAAPRPAAAQQPPPAVRSLGSVIGRVVDDARCAPVAGAQVRLVGDRTRTATTDAAGRFRFAAVVDSTAEVIVGGAAGAPRAPQRLRAQPGAALAYAEFRLRPGGDGAADRSAGAGPTVTTVPARPTQGTAFRLRVVLPADGDALTGELGSERLHFARTGPRTFESLAAAPLDAPDSLPLVLGRAGPDGLAPGLRVRIALPVARGDFPLERLRVAPEFGREPDLALAERLERESERARDVGCRAHQTPRLWTEPFARPRPGRVTSRFGRGREYNGTVTSRHTGTDFAGATGAPVRATNRGVVRLVDRFYLGGNVVYLDHGAGVVSAYMHLSRTAVARGDTVARGQVIGRVGSTGRVTGPHLHWVVRYGRTSVDPESLLAVSGGR